MTLIALVPIQIPSSIAVLEFNNLQTMQLKSKKVKVLQEQAVGTD